MKLSRAKVVGAVLAVSLLTPALFFLSPSSFANLFRSLPLLSALLGGVLGVVLILRELLFIVQKAWRVRESRDEGAGPFRAVSKEAWATHVPQRIWRVWTANGTAGLVLARFGRIDLRSYGHVEGREAVGELLARVAMVEAAILAAAIVMWIAGWALLTRRAWQKRFASASFVYVAILATVWLLFSRPLEAPALNVLGAAVWAFALSASGWLAYETLTPAPSA